MEVLRGYMKFKIISGKLSLDAERQIIKKKHQKTPFTLKSMSYSMGQVSMTYQGGWSEPVVIITEQMTSGLESFTIVTDENKVNFTGALGWGIVGGALTGGVGLLAGALLGGRGKTMLFAIRWKDGSQFLCEGPPKKVLKFQMGIS